MSGVYGMYGMHGIDAEIEVCLCTCLLVTLWGIIYYVARTVQPDPVWGVEGGSWYHVNALLRVKCVGAALPGVGLVLERLTRLTCFFAVSKKQLRVLAALVLCPHSHSAG